MPLSLPDVGEVEQRYVLAALRSGWVAPAGPDLEAFETEIARAVGAHASVAVSSGTAALHLALLHWGIGPGDVVPVSTMTFAATVNAIRYVGAEPLFVDSEAESGNIDPEALRDAVRSASIAGHRVPVVIPVDLFGKIADIDAVSAAAPDARVLCDAAESLGSTRGGRSAGAWGDAAVLSFNGNKIMTTSGGGMLLSSDEGLIDHARKMASQSREPAVHYEHVEIGYNYRLSNILAALGRAQLTRLGDMIHRRRAWRHRYRSLLPELPDSRILGAGQDEGDNCWLTCIVFDDASHKDSLEEHLRREMIETRPLWKPMHLQPVFRHHARMVTGVSEKLFASGLALPSGSGMTEEQFERVERAMRAWAASR